MSGIAIVIKLSVLALSVDEWVIFQQTIITHAINGIIIIVDEEPMYSVLSSQHRVLRWLVNSSKTHQINIISAQQRKIEMFAFLCLPFAQIVFC